jgi:5-(carboxyamino)imidazole ribonucleotide synthase
MTIGIVGAGQLGRMMALAGYPLGFDFLFLDRDVQTPGGQVGPILAGDLDDRNLLAQLSQRCEVLTFDWENIPVEALEGLPGSARISPPLRALGCAQDRPISGMRNRRARARSLAFSENLAKTLVGRNLKACALRGM